MLSIAPLLGRVGVATVCVGPPVTIVWVHGSCHLTLITRSILCGFYFGPFFGRFFTRYSITGPLLPLIVEILHQLLMFIIGFLQCCDTSTEVLQKLQLALRHLGLCFQRKVLAVQNGGKDFDDILLTDWSTLVFQI